MEPEILQQLIWIKWLLIAIVCVFVAIGIAFLWIMRSFAKIPDQIKADVSFADRARSLLDQGKPEEAAQLAKTRIAKYPADAQALWVLGQAIFRTGDLRGALISLKRAQELQPEWEATYTGPLIRLIEQRMNEGGAKTELKVVPLNQLSDTDAPPLS